MLWGLGVASGRAWMQFPTVEEQLVAQWDRQAVHLLSLWGLQPNRSPCYATAQVQQWEVASETTWDAFLDFCGERFCDELLALVCPRVVSGHTDSVGNDCFLLNFLLFNRSRAQTCGFLLLVCWRAASIIFSNLTRAVNVFTFCFFRFSPLKQDGWFFFGFCCRIFIKFFVFRFVKM